MLRIFTRRQRTGPPTEPPLSLQSAVVSDVGPRRPNNEDAAFAGRRLLAVADGMGGLPDGELASDLAIRALAGLEDDPAGSLEDRFRTASDAIRAASEAAPERAGMGTTLTALLLAPTEARCVVAHIGDSRCYLLRDNRLALLTRDDSYVQFLVDQGELTDEEARRHPHRSYLMQAMQGQPVGPSMTITLRPKPGDLFLLCSDGLSDVLDDDAIAVELRASPGPAACARRLVELALAHGASDNVTVVTAEVVGRRNPDRLSP